MNGILPAPLSFGRVFVVLVCGLAATGLLGSEARAAGALDERVRQLATVETQRETLEQIRDAADPAFAGVLQALMEGALYRWSDRLMILLKTLFKISEIGMDLSRLEKDLGGSTPDHDDARNLVISLKFFNIGNDLLG